MSKTLSAAPCGTACGRPAIVKNGHHACGSAQFACRACGARRVLAPKRQSASAARQQEILRAVATERLSLRGAERVFDSGAADDCQVARKKAEALPPLSTTLLPAEAGDVLELDELWSFAGSKANPRGVWIALCRQTRQVVAYFIGDRSADSARALRERIPPAYRCRATRRDFWLAYEKVFPQRTHRMCGKAEGQTNHVERWNCTLRQRLGRFVRKTLSFSKCDHMHELALRLFIHGYNQQPITY